MVSLYLVYKLKRKGNLNIYHRYFKCNNKVKRKFLIDLKMK